jgi:Zn-dependent protease with chaperone function
MGPSKSFLLSLGALLAQSLTMSPLPGRGDPDVVLALLLLVPLPAILAFLGRRALLRMSTWTVPTRRLRLLLLAPSLTIPSVFALLVLVGDLPDLAETLAPNSWSLQMSILLTPLVAMEVTTRIAEWRTVRRLALLRLPGGGSLGPRQLPMVGLTIAALFAFAAMTDLLSTNRTLEVFFAGTSAGSTVGLLLLGASLCVFLPLAFRFFLPTSPLQPPPVQDLVERTARDLHFPISQIRMLRTGHTMVNAAMVGPLSWPRYLLLTDGLLSILGPAALRGVIAHEVGHARRGHPGLLLLLFGFVPFVLAVPLSSIDLSAWSSTTLAILGLAGAGTALLLVRLIAHRFEYEADLWSAQALGGAAPCIEALKGVGILNPEHKYRGSFRHPSEHDRVEKLALWDRSREFRAAFLRQGRRLRFAIAATALVALVVSGIAHARVWPLDHGLLEFWTGDFPRAERILTAIDEASLTDGELLQRRLALEELAAAREIEPGGGAWHEIRERLAVEGWYRGLRELAERGASAARPWLILALADPAPTPLVRATCIWVTEVAEEGDPARIEELTRHLLGFGERLPAELSDALRGVTPLRPRTDSGR